MALMWTQAPPKICTPHTPSIQTGENTEQLHSHSMVLASAYFIIPDVVCPQRDLECLKGLDGGWVLCSLL